MPGAGGQGGADDSGGEMPVSCDEPPAPSPLVGWASVPGSGSGTTSIDTTTGGDVTPVVVVSTLADLNAALMGTTPAVVQIAGITISGNVRVGSNKTIVGTCGADDPRATSQLSQLDQRHHPQPQDRRATTARTRPRCRHRERGTCSAGRRRGDRTGTRTTSGSTTTTSPDGSDGNLDINQGADNITISWHQVLLLKSARSTRGRRRGGHEFSEPDRQLGQRRRAPTPATCG